MRRFAGSRQAGSGQGDAVRDEGRVLEEARSQKPEARSQKPEARSQKPEARSQKPEARSVTRRFPILEKIPHSGFWLLASWLLASFSMISRTYLQDRQKGLLGNIHFAHPLHPPFAFFLLFQQLALAGDVTAVALRQDVLADGSDGLAGNDPVADGGLDGYLEHLAGDQFPHFF